MENSKLAPFSYCATCAASSLYSKRLRRIRITKGGAAFVLRQRAHGVSMFRTQPYPQPPLRGEVRMAPRRTPWARGVGYTATDSLQPLLRAEALGGERGAGEGEGEERGEGEGESGGRREGESGTEV
jgi:hypothetical protein